MSMTCTPGVGMVMNSAAPAAGADGLSIESALKATQFIAHGRSASVGRKAQVLLGVGDEHMHAIAFQVIAGTTWSVVVPQGNSLWVDVFPSWTSTRVAAIGPGDRQSFTGTHEVRVRTRSATHRLKVTHTTHAVARRRRPTDTVLGGRIPHVWVLLCVERVRSSAGIALSDEDLGLLLGVNPSAAKKQLSRAREAIDHVVGGWSGELGATNGQGLDRAKVVDWLVSTGLVTTADVDKAVAAVTEGARRKERAR